MWNVAGRLTSSDGGPNCTTIRLLPDVREVESTVQTLAVPTSADSTPLVRSLSVLDVEGSVYGLSFDMDRPGVVQGRMADPSHG